ncbi:MAG: serine/threonine-protein phosphatase, partial [Candidatus Riflebacteria bacterium]|nr:serine/threonine-protein phosphatase [Candidatus Riflebacteria bacterium]
CHKKDGEFTYIRKEKRNPVLGVSKKIKYQEYRLTLSPGDKLFFYTDGITEAMNSQRELYNESRLKSALDSVSDECSANEMLSTIYSDVKKHVGDAEQSDDMTMLGLVYKQKKVSN